jgi:hypothetical protein
MAHIVEKEFFGPMCWMADTALDDEGIVYLNKECLAELETLAKELKYNPLPAELLRPEFFNMPACLSLLSSVQSQIHDGTGIAIIDRIPEHLIDDIDIGKKIYWLLLSMVGRPVAQKWDGTLLYDVQDEGGVDAAGSAIRSSKTNGDQGYHIDNAFNLPPQVVSLLCLQTAQEGGTSGVISFETVHNLLLKEYPDILPRLYDPFHFDRQMEHAPGEVRTISKPIFEKDGDTIKTNYSPNVIYRGYEMLNGDMDHQTNAALNAIKEVAERDGIGKSLEFERGQIQILNNKRIGHRRTGYIDWPDLERRRHLVRILLREEGRPFYLG